MSQFFKKRAQQREEKGKQPHHTMFNDEAAIQAAAKTIKQLGEASSINGSPFLNQGYLKGYYLKVVENGGKESNYVGFVWPALNVQVLEFLVRAAKQDAINGIIGFTPNVCIVKEYKLK